MWLRWKAMGEWKQADEACANTLSDGNQLTQLIEKCCELLEQEPSEKLNTVGQQIVDQCHPSRISRTSFAVNVSHYSPSNFGTTFLI